MNIHKTANFTIYGLIVAAFFIGLAFAIAGYGIAKKTIKPETIIKTEYIEIPILPSNELLAQSREDVSNTIKEYRRTQYFEKIVVQFYNRYVNDIDLTYLILSAADMYGIPENVLFALIWAESNFNPGAVNGHGNKDGSNDKGLMQLNSRYFGKINRLDPRINLQYGCKHLVDRYKRYGSWDEAIMLYNGFSMKSAQHQAKVLAKERELDKAFTIMCFNQIKKDLFSKEVSKIDDKELLDNE
ncbi:MAG: lytic transglycosylase domain-containing protein [Promethearchaeota archaeon]